MLQELDAVPDKRSCNVFDAQNMSEGQCIKIIYNKITTIHVFEGSGDNLLERDRKRVILMR